MKDIVKTFLYNAMANELSCFVYIISFSEISPWPCNKYVDMLVSI